MQYSKSESNKTKVFRKRRDYGLLDFATYHAAILESCWRLKAGCSAFQCKL